MSQQKTTILIATGLYPPEIGGPATYTKLLEEELPKHGFAVSVLPFSTVRRWPKVLRHLLYFCKAFAGALRADIVYAQDPVSVGLPALLAAKLTRTPFVLKVVGDYAWEQYVGAHIGSRKFVSPEDFQNRDDVGLLTKVRRYAERLVARSADAIIVPSDYLKSIVKMWEVREEKIVVIPNAIILPNMKNTRDALRRHYGLTGMVILSVGRLVPWKGFDTLIDLFPRVLKMIPDAMLVIIGDGPQRDYLKARARKSGARHRIVFAGRLERTNVLAYLRAADLFVLNTGYEGFSHQLLEAMYMGMPVVTTGSGGNPELISQGETGLLVPYDDETLLCEAMIALIKDSVSARAIANRAREHARQFSVRRMVGATSDVLEETA